MGVDKQELMGIEHDLLQLETTIYDAQAALKVLHKKISSLIPYDDNIEIAKLLDETFSSVTSNSDTKLSNMIYRLNCFVGNMMRVSEEIECSITKFKSN